MNYLLIFLCALSLAFQAAVRKSYSNKVSERGTILFNGCSCLAAALFFWVCKGFRFEYDASVVYWALTFGMFFGLSTFASFKALQIGPLSLTSLVALTTNTEDASNGEFSVSFGLSSLKGE